MAETHADATPTSLYVTLPEIAPASTRAKFTFAVVAPLVTVAGVRIDEFA
jgi:hypothetical protein